MLVDCMFYRYVYKGAFLGQLLQKPDSVSGDANIAIQRAFLNLFL